MTRDDEIRKLLIEIIDLLRALREERTRDDEARVDAILAQPSRPSFAVREPALPDEALTPELRTARELLRQSRAVLDELLADGWDR